VKHEADHQRQIDGQIVVASEHRKERKAPGREPEPAKGVNRPPPDAVGQGREEGNGEELDGCAEQESVQSQAPRLRRDVHQVSEREDREDVI